MHAQPPASLLTSFVDVGADDQGGGPELITYQKCPYTITFNCPAAQFPVVLALMMMIMSFIGSCRNKIGAELHIYLEEGTYHKRLFRGPSTDDMKT